jgi:hypothetical protein
VQHAFKHRSDTDDQLEIVGLGGSEKDRRWRIVLDVDDQVPITRCLRACGCERGVEFLEGGTCVGAVVRRAVVVESAT